MTQLPVKAICACLYKDRNMIWLAQVLSSVDLVGHGGEPLTNELNAKRERRGCCYKQGK